MSRCVAGERISRNGGVRLAELPDLMSAKIAAAKERRKGSHFRISFHVESREPGFDARFDVIVIAQELAAFRHVHGESTEISLRDLFTNIMGKVERNSMDQQLRGLAIYLKGRLAPAQDLARFEVSYDPDYARRTNNRITFFR
jgi:hypothetical protein